MFSRKVVCPYCKEEMKPRKKARGNTLVGLFLCLLFLLPGIIYFIAYSGYDKVCRNCGMKLPMA